MKTRRFTRKNTNPSKLHQRLREALTKLFPNHVIYEEYSYKRILPKNAPEQNQCARLKSDFYIKGMCVVEGQGEQHSKPVSFGKGGYKTKEQLFSEQRDRDELKRRVCRKYRIPLVEVWFNEEIDNDMLWDKIMNAQRF